MASHPVPAPRDSDENDRWANDNSRSPIARFMVESLHLVRATNDNSALWEPFALEYLNMVDETTAPCIAISKSRQIGFSFILGMEAVARAALYPKSLINFVSINKDEAEQKIRYAREINECLYKGVQLKWTTDNRSELEATNGSRIISHACTPPRGMPKAHHRLDEIAHYQRPKEIYDAAVPAMLRGGSIVIGSSPWVRGGFHYTVMEESDQYPLFSRMYIPWWEILGFCTDIESAIIEAPRMSTQERVERFGTDRLKMLFYNMSIDSFQVECELAYSDDTVAWITWEEISQCISDDDSCIIANGIDETMQAIPRLLTDDRHGLIYAGYDVARKHDFSVLTLAEQINDVVKVKAILILKGCRFEDQKMVLKALTPIIERGCIDETGLGANLAEDMNSFNPAWAGVTMTAPSKSLMATDLRKQFQAKQIIIPADRELQMDIHSIQRVVTAANNVIFDADRDEHGHADRFWSLALMLNAAIRQTYKFEIYSVGGRDRMFPDDPLLKPRDGQVKRKDENGVLGYDQTGKPITSDTLRRHRRR